MKTTNLVSEARDISVHYNSLTIGMGSVKLRLVCK